MSGRLSVSVNERLDVLAVAAEARALAKSAGIDAGFAEELALVVAELGMNAVRHGAGSRTVHVTVSALGWRVEVEDQGPGLSAAVLADGGRSDRLGVGGVRSVSHTRGTFGSGLAAVRRLSNALSLSNKATGGARIIAHRDF